MAVRFGDDAAAMNYALALAARGLGAVEPNPAVGAVIVDHNRQIVGEGHHRLFGGPHAEVHAIADAGPRARGATLYVTLEPCCHHGKTPPCVDAVLAAGLRRVVVGMQDPAPHVAGRGIERLKQAGLEVEVGLLEDQVRRLNAPFIKFMTSGRPYVHAKWAMTLDGKIAARTGASRWISGEASRRVVHQLRGRMDAILIGSGTARQDDPLLTARPPGPRTPVRIVLDSRGTLPGSSQLLQTVGEAPVLVVVGPRASHHDCRRLESAGAEVLRLDAAGAGEVAADRPDLAALLDELGRRQMTNLFIEGGGAVLGSFFDARLIDEVHVFVAPKLVGGADAFTPVGGLGLPEIPQQGQVKDVTIQQLENDIYLRGFLN